MIIIRTLVVWCFVIWVGFKKKSRFFSTSYFLWCRLLCSTSICITVKLLIFMKHSFFIEQNGKFKYEWKKLHWIYACILIFISTNWSALLKMNLKVNHGIPWFHKQQTMVITCEHGQIYFLFVINSYCYNGFGDEWICDCRLNKTTTKNLHFDEN